MRLRMVQPRRGPAEREPGAGLRHRCAIVTAIGEAIARSGALSTRTLEELRQTLHVAGFRGEHGLGLFVGTKLLLVVGLPLLPCWRCRGCCTSTCRIRPRFWRWPLASACWRPTRSCSICASATCARWKAACPTRWI